MVNSTTGIPERCSGSINNYVVFYCKSGGKWWTMLKKVQAVSYTDVITTINLPKKPKDIIFKPRNDKKGRLEAIKFSVKNYDYKIVNWEKKEPSYE